MPGGREDQRGLSAESCVAPHLVPPAGSVLDRAERFPPTQAVDGLTGLGQSDLPPPSTHLMDASLSPLKQGLINDRRPHSNDLLQGRWVRQACSEAGWCSSWVSAQCCEEFIASMNSDCRAEDWEVDVDADTGRCGMHAVGCTHAYPGSYRYIRRTCISRSRGSLQSLSSTLEGRQRSSTSRT